MSFNFGAPATTTPSTPFGFNAAASTQQSQPATGFSFGGAQSAPMAASTPFGLSATQPSQTATGSQFNFGSTTPQQPAQSSGTFGFGSATQPTPVAASTPFNFSSATQQPTPGPSGVSLFGAQATPPAVGTGATPFSFSTPSVAGTTMQPIQPLGSTGTTGFTFGTPSAATSQPIQPVASTTTTISQPIIQPSGTTGFTFGTPSAATLQPAQTVTTTTTTTIAQPAQPLVSTTSTGFSFGTPSAAASQSTQPVASTATTISQPTQPVVSTTSTGFTFGTPSVATSQSTQPVASTTTTTSQPAQPVVSTGSTGFSFGTSQPTQTVTTTTTASATTTLPSTTLFTGLGGIPSTTSTSDPSQLVSGSFGGYTGPEEKNSPVPPEIMELVEGLRNHIRDQKNKLAELARSLDKRTDKVTDIYEEVRLKLANTSNLIHRQMLNCNSLKEMVERDHKDGEMVQITNETPAALQYDHKLPYKYFFGILYNYEAKMTLYKEEILKAEVALKSMEVPTAITATDLYNALQSSKDLLVILAAKVKTIHDRVLAEVETNHNLLNIVHGDFRTNNGNVLLSQTAGLNPQFASLQEKLDYLNRSILFPSQFPRVPSRIPDYNSLRSIPPVTQRSSNLHSTQLPYGGRQFDNTTSFNVSGYGTSLFQTPISPIYPSASGASLKRTKH